MEAVKKEGIESIGEEFSTPQSLTPPPSPPLSLKKEMAAEALAALEENIQKISVQGQPKITTKQSPPEPEKVTESAKEVTNGTVREKENKKKDGEVVNIKEEIEEEKTDKEDEKGDIPWAQCYQKASALARCENDDALLLLCNQYLTLEDNISLGQTCRRLYSIYRQAMGCVQHLQLSHLDVYSDYRPIYESYENQLWKFSKDQEEQQQQQPSPESQLKNLQITLSDSRLFLRGEYQLMPSFLLSSGLLSSAQLPNLISLDLTTGHLGTTFFLADLFGSLNSLQRLESLRLNVRCRHWLIDEDARFPSAKSARVTKGPPMKLSQVEHSKLLEPPSAQLRLPVLKHLTLALKNVRLCEEGEKIRKRRKSLVGKLVGWLGNIAGHHSPKDCIFAIDCPQLNSFHFFSADKLTDVCEIIRKTVLPNSKLANAETGQVHIIQQLLRDNSLPKELETVSPALAHITHLWVEHEYESAPLLRLLPTLRGLQEIKLFLRDFDESVRQPEVLAALSALPHLHSILLDCRDSRFGNQFSTLPLRLETPIQLTNVTSISIIFSSAFHEQLVGKNRLAECFPCLTTFRATFVLNCCRVCGFIVGPSNRASTLAGARTPEAAHPYGRIFNHFSKGLTVVEEDVEEEVKRWLMPCAQNLTRDLSTLNVEPQQMQVRFMGPTMRVNPYLSYNAVEKRVEWA